MSQRPEFRNRLRKLGGGIQLPSGILMPNGKPAKPVEMNVQHVSVQIIAALAGKLAPGRGVVVGNLPDFAGEVLKLEKWITEQPEGYILPPVEVQNLEAVRMLARWNAEAMAWSADADRALAAKDLDPDA